MRNAQRSGFRSRPHSHGKQRGAVVTNPGNRPDDLTRYLDVFLERLSERAHRLPFCGVQAFKITGPVVFDAFFSLTHRIFLDHDIANDESS
jgi:hypothetical protein